MREGDEAASQEALQMSDTLKRKAKEYLTSAKDKISRAKRLAGGVDGNGSPDELRCPITKELMVDPVIAADGHTYERSAIERVFADKPSGENPMSPVTGLVLSSRSLIPNIAIRSQCMDYRQGSE